MWYQQDGLHGGLLFKCFHAFDEYKAVFVAWTANRIKLFRIVVDFTDQFIFI
jgi:hypothetical protein